MKETRLKAKKREGTGKSFVKAMRRNGEIPCVIYGHGEPAIPASINTKDFEQIIKNNPTGIGVVNIEITGMETFWSLVKRVQKNPINDDIWHIDFQHLHKGETIIVDVPVRSKGTPVGEKEGGILEQVAHKIRVKVLPSKIISSINVDVSDLKIGQVIHIKDLDIGDAELDDNPDRVVLHVVRPRVVEEVKPEVEEEVEKEPTEEAAKGKEEKEEKTEGGE